MRREHLNAVKTIIEETTNKKKLKERLMLYAMNILDVNFRFFRDNYVRPLVIIDQQLSPEARKRVIKALHLRGFNDEAKKKVSKQ